jgi:hypothetical protein
MLALIAMNYAASPASQVCKRFLGHAFDQPPAAVFMAINPLKRRHGDADSAEFTAPSHVPPASETGGNRP